MKQSATGTTLRYTHASSFENKSSAESNCFQGKRKNVCTSEAHTPSQQKEMYESGNRKNNKNGCVCGDKHNNNNNIK